MSTIGIREYEVEVDSKADRTPNHELMVDAGRLSASIIEPCTSLRTPGMPTLPNAAICSFADRLVNMQCKEDGGS